MFASLWPHALQLARLPCPSLSLRVCSDSCSLSPWCHLTISSSVTLFPSCPQSFPASESLPWVSSSHQMAKVLELQHQSFQWIFRVDFLWGWLVWSPCSPRDSKKSSAPQFKSINSSVLSLLCDPAITSVRFLVAQVRRYLPAKPQTQVWSVVWEDPLRRQPTPVFWPGKSHGHRSQVGYSPWGFRESDTTEQQHNC